MRESAASSRFGHLICALALFYIGLNPVLSPVRAQNPFPQRETLSWPLKLRGQMLRLNDVEWRLRVAAGANCPDPSSATGLTIDQIAAYDPHEHAMLQRDLGMTTLPQIAAVAIGSPAAFAGIKPGDEIRSIDGVAPHLVVPQTGDRELLAEDLMDWLAARPAGIAITMELQRGNLTFRKLVMPIALCAGRAILKTDDTLDAYSDRHDLAITTGIISFTANDDELGLIVGHELAHVVLAHAQGGSASELRKREVEADTLGANLAHCAGYDVVNGAAFWHRYGAHYAARWPRLATHASPERRQRGIEDAAPTFTCPVSLPAKAWSGPK